MHRFQKVFWDSPMEPNSGLDSGQPAEALLPSFPLELPPPRGVKEMVGTLDHKVQGVPAASGPHRLHRRHPTVPVGTARGGDSNIAVPFA